MKYFIWAIGIVILVVSCTGNASPDVSRMADSNMYHAKDDDLLMNEAIKMANGTLDIFNKALVRKDSGIDNFALKVQFKTPVGYEHIWATDIELKNGHFIGVIDNTPENTEQVKKGDTIRIDKKDISDWMYSENGVLIGGFTIKVIRNRMSKEEKTKFDNDFPYKIKD